MTSRRGAVRRGFTLVELLVVIGIIALLISILLPTLSRAQEAGRRISCASNLRQLAMAVLMYNNDFKALPGPTQSAIFDPLIANDPNGVMSGTVDKDRDREWTLSNENRLWRYVGRSRQLFLCPSNVSLRETASPFSSSSRYYGQPLGYSYKVNNQDNTGKPYFFGSWFLTDSAEWRRPKKLSEVKSHYNQLSNLASTRNNYLNTRSENMHAKIWMFSDIDSRVFPHSTSTVFGLDDGNLALTKRKYQPPHRSGKPGRNYSFFDGHVEWAQVDTTFPINP